MKHKLNDKMKLKKQSNDKQRISKTKIKNAKSLKNI